MDIEYSLPNEAGNCERPITSEDALKEATQLVDMLIAEHSTHIVNKRLVILKIADVIMNYKVDTRSLFSRKVDSLVPLVQRAQMSNKANLPTLNSVPNKGSGSFNGLCSLPAKSELLAAPVLKK